MKVLYITNLPAPYKVRFFNELGNMVDLTVVYERHTASNRNKEWKYKSKINFEEIYLKSKYIGEESSFSLGVIRLIKKRKFDSIIMNGFSSLTAILTIAYMRNKHIQYGIMCDGMLRTANRRIKDMIKKFLISGAQYCLSSNSITTEILADYGAKKENIYFYPFSSISSNEILVHVYDRNIYKERIGFGDKKIILFVGQFIYRKGIDVLIKAFLKINSISNENIHLLLVGGNELDESIPLELSDKVHIIGFKKAEELKDYFMAADVLALPTREDIWGLVVNEALACGTPVVTTEQCGAGQALIIDGVNGYVVPVNDSQLLAEKIDAIIKSKMNPKVISHVMEQFTIQKMAETTYKVLDKVISL